MIQFQYKLIIESIRVPIIMFLAFLNQFYDGTSQTNLSQLLARVHKSFVSSLCLIHQCRYSDGIVHFINWTSPHDFPYHYMDVVIRKVMFT